MSGLRGNKFVGSVFFLSRKPVKGDYPRCQVVGSEQLFHDRVQKYELKPPPAPSPRVLVQFRISLGKQKNNLSANFTSWGHFPNCLLGSCVFDWRPPPPNFKNTKRVPFFNEASEKAIIRRSAVVGLFLCLFLWSDRHPKPPLSIITELVVLSSPAVCEK